jgi:hypothetical protein
MAIIDSDLLVGDSSISQKIQAMEAAAKQAEADLMCTFDWNGNIDIPCVGGPQFEGMDLDIAGWVPRRKVKIKFRLKNIPDDGMRPARNHVIDYRGSSDATSTRYRIKATKNWFDVLMELECEEGNQ